eukprot:CAMPEP_0167742986 /NCGR_PEP_ID=MMETSP0110_2-20121227/1754_1 /TAXON_ID=629695 /ORGANISM="Gymnochlora sp., Strain CCMP2014" /LENGTH=152 /DNA_ID=CAMNT_0007627285 /DNA_START=994 /DNA_END=1449 /DNA_ORIENTATION=+
MDAESATATIFDNKEDGVEGTLMVDVGESVDASLNGNSLATLFGGGDEDEDEDEDEEDEDFDPENPNAGEYDEGEDSDYAGHKRYREDPAMYVPLPKKMRTEADGKYGESKEIETRPLSQIILTESTMILAKIMSYLDLKVKLRVCSVCQAW